MACKSRANEIEGQANAQGGQTKKVIIIIIIFGQVTITRATTKSFEAGVGPQNGTLAIEILRKLGFAAIASQS